MITKLHVFLQNKNKSFNESSNKIISCTNCGWEWNKKDTKPSDAYVCHKCGKDNTILESVQPMTDQINPTEKPKKIYEYGCVMLELPVSVKDWWENEILSLIDDNDLYIPEESPDRYGKENEVHVTVKYGLHDWEFQMSELKKEVETWGDIEISFQNITLFENELFDVVKFDVDSERLHELNKIVSDNYPCTDTYPDYHPHATIAYVKPGTGKKYIKSFEEPFKFICNQVKISGSGNDERVELHVNTTPTISKLN